MNTKEQLESIKEIKDLMNKSTKFMSLNGWAGILSGTYACVAAIVVYSYLDYSLKPRFFSNEDDIFFGFVGLVTLVLALTTSIIASKIKAKKFGYKIWDNSAKQGFTHLAIPLFIGFLFSLALYLHHLEGLIAPTTLIFYGLALFSASHFSFKEIKQLAYIELALGVLNLFFIGYGLIFWTLGFGIAHIIYGFIVKRTHG